MTQQRLESVIAIQDFMKILLTICAKLVTQMTQNVLFATIQHVQLVQMVSQMTQVKRENVSAHLKSL
jgi:hypothetical protein